METLWKDVRYSFRLLLKKPGFAAVVILTLALGIGANTAVFTVINAVLLRPLPYPQSDRIAFVWESRLTDPAMEDSLSPHNFTDIRSRSRSFDAYCAYTNTTMTLTGNAAPEALIAVKASSDFARTLGVNPAMGRFFGADEDLPGKKHVVVLSDGLWRREFGADPHIVGKLIRLDGELHAVLGVMPADFAFPNSETELWVPLALDLSTYQRGTSFLSTVGRLKSGVSAKTASSDLLQVAAQLRKEYANELGPDFSVRVVPMREYLYGSLERPLMILFGSVALVLLIACVNVANLTLGRSSARVKEMAVRSALGASGSHILRLLLTEGVLLAIGGGLVGLLLASNGVQLLAALPASVIPAGAAISIDSRVMLFTLVMSILTGMLFTLGPAWHVARTGMNQALHDNSRSSTGGRGVKLFRACLVVAEIALSLVLLVGAGLLFKSLWRELEVKPGFDAQNVIACGIALPQTRYSDAQRRIEFFRQTLEKVRALPGVQSAGFATSLPFSGSRGTSSFSIDGRTNPTDPNSPEADRHQVSPGYFHTMRIPIRSGRDFTEHDNLGTQQVIIINEALAKKYWPGENPIGKHLTIGMAQETAIYGHAVSREVVGIIGNVKHEYLTDDFKSEMYIPAWQLPPASLTLVVRGNASAESIVAEVRRQVLSIDSEQPVRKVKVLQDLVTRSMGPQRFLTMLLLVFAGLALALAVIGIYAVMSFSVTQRIQEIGVRMALGATPLDAMQLVLRQGTLLALLGLGAGIAVALGLTRVMREVLFEVSATDPITIVTVSGLLFVVTLMACLIPARRATRVDPLVALRCE